MLSSSRSCLMALRSPMERLEVGALAWERMPTTRKRAASATSSGSLRRPFSTAATYGTRLGVGAKLRPFSSTDSSSGCNCLLERFPTLRSEEPPARFPLVRFKNGDHDSMSCCLSLGCLDCLSSRNSDLMLSLLSLSFSSMCVQFDGDNL